MPTGIHTINDLRVTRFGTASEFGLDAINKVLQADLSAWNANVNELVSLFAEVTVDRLRAYGSSGRIDMEEVDEMGKPATRKVLTGTTIGVPMRLYKSAIGWTSKWLETHTPAEMAELHLKIQTGHAARVIREIRRAVYNNLNYTFTDFLVDNVALPVVRFCNADGMAIPDSPGGVQFDGAVHDHFMATATLVIADVDALIDTVTEHGHTQGVGLYISLANQAAFTALASFTPLSSAHVVNLVGMQTDVKVTGEEDVENRLIGYWNGVVPVFVKPYAVANYILCMATESSEKPLCFRQRSQESLQGLRIAAEINDYPLIAQNYESEFGIGVYCRTAGAVLFTAGAVWANPTL